MDAGFQHDEALARDRGLLNAARQARLGIGASTTPAGFAGPPPAPPDGGRSGSIA
jgi:hypothetical protein